MADDFLSAGDAVDSQPGSQLIENWILASGSVSSAEERRPH